MGEILRDVPEKKRRERREHGFGSSKKEAGSNVLQTAKGQKYSGDDPHSASCQQLMEAAGPQRHGSVVPREAGKARQRSSQPHHLGENRRPEVKKPMTSSVRMSQQEPVGQITKAQCFGAM